jgi:carbon storage regulator CsrA
MLILTRKLNEEIVIGHNRDIIVKITRIDKDTVKLGITANAEIPVHRAEVFAKVFGAAKSPTK